ncbi:MAG: Tm-1-like ATP-binding domain-containing protein, partial [Pseudomonadota bacterium]
MPLSLKPQAPVLVVASLETKHEEVNDLVSRVGRHGFQSEVIDTSLRSGGVQLDGKGKVAAMHACAKSANAAIRQAMAGGAQVVVGIGGGTGAQIIAEAISDLPFAMPKIIINTMAHDMRPDTADNSVIIIPSVSDLAGMNPTLRQVFENAAAVIAGLARAATFHPHISTSPTIGMTTLGTTSQGADKTKALLQKHGLEVTAFHANGYGGKAFTRWCQCGAFSGVLDFTTHEVTRVLFDRACSVPAERYKAAARSNLPQVVLPG